MNESTQILKAENLRGSMSPFYSHTTHLWKSGLISSNKT